MWDNHNRYWFGNQLINHTSAKADCEGRGAILATVEDIAEMEFYSRAAFNITGYRPRNLLIGKKRGQQKQLN